MSKLAPCPFCGHDKPSFERMGTSRQSCIVICGNCGCRHESSDEYLNSGASWNERAPSTPPEALTKPWAQKTALGKAPSLIIELETAAERFTRYSNDSIDGLLQEAADVIRALAAPTPGAPEALSLRDVLSVLDNWVNTSDLDDLADRIRAALAAPSTPAATQAQASELPELPGHPDPHAWTWTEAEKRVIREWGESILNSRAPSTPAAECPYCGKPLINCKCWGEVHNDAARFRWLCMHPDWRFIEQLCQEFVAESSKEFYRRLCDAIDKRRDAAPSTPAAEPGFGLDEGQLANLLAGSLKPEEIAGTPDVQHLRVRELLHWFARFTQGNANGKWATRHACELAYYLATEGKDRKIDIRAMQKAAFEEGLKTSPEERAMLGRLGVDVGQPAATQAQASGQAFDHIAGTDKMVAADLVKEKS